MERTRTGSKLACRPALVLFILYGASRAIERERDWQHGLQSGTEGVLGASRAIERERDWQHGLQSGTGGLGASCKGSFQGRSILGLKKGISPRENQTGNQ